MKIQLEQVQKQLNSMKEYERRLFELEEQLLQVMRAPLIKQELFASIHHTIKKQCEKLREQIANLQSLICVLEKVMEYNRCTEESIVQQYSDGQYRYVWPDIRIMVVKNVIPLPNIVLD